MPTSVAVPRAETQATCPACGCSKSRAAFRSTSLKFRRCRACATLWDPEPLPATQIEALYDGPEYFVKDQQGAEGETLWGYPDDYIANRPNVEGKFHQTLGHLERYIEPGRILDIGAGPGFLLTAASERRWTATGVDLNRWAVDYARDELGMDARLGSVSEVGFSSGEFDAVTMMDLIEHLTDPGTLIEEVARVVRHDGAVAVLTPDAGSVVSRALGARWPEVRRPGEHAVLFSVGGLSRLLERYGLIACGWHSTGKTASLASLVADVTPVVPGLARGLRKRLENHPFGQRDLEFDPRTKFCLYARRVASSRRAPRHRPAKVPKQPDAQASVAGAIVEELRHLANASRYCDWLFDQFDAYVHGRVAEVGAGIGTFSERILARGVHDLLLVEPEAECAETLQHRFEQDPRVSLSRDELPDAPSLSAEGFDLVVCQNVLEHISDDRGALATMSAALVKSGHLALIVPALPRLYGPLDEAYGHRRRYAASDVAEIVRATGLQIETLRHLNAPGIGAWWLKNRRPGARVGPGALQAYERVVQVERPIESRATPPKGLSLVCIASKS